MGRPIHEVIERSFRRPGYKFKSFLPVIVITSLACVITNDFYFHIPFAYLLNLSWTQGGVSWGGVSYAL
jgi:hypothetical protein